MKSKLTFFSILVILLLFAPITVFSVTPVSTLTTQVFLLNAIQRLIGLWAYSLLIIQIILGSFMSRWIEKYGAWIFKYHVIEGLIIYFLLVLHPALFVIFRYKLGQSFDPFYVFVDVCLLCKESMEYAYNFGRIGFWLLTIGVIAAYFRATIPFLRSHWHKFHILNYIAFFSLYIHSLQLGTDVGTFPFSLIHTPMFIVIAIISSWKSLNFLMGSRKQLPHKLGK